MARAMSAVEHWRKLAAEDDATAEHEERRGSSGNALRARARLSRDAARSIELTEQTGIDHCACHLTPASLHKPRPLR